MADGESLGTAVLELVADSSGLDAGLLKAKLSSVKTFMEAGKGAKLALAGGLAAGALVAGKALYNVGEQFDSAYDKIETRTGATGKKLDGLKDDFRAVAKDVPDDFESISTAIGEVNSRLGVTGKPLQDLTKQFVELSRITKTDVRTNIDAVSKAFKDAGIPVSEQSKALDGLFRISQKTGIGVADLATQMFRFGSPLRQLGFTFQQSAAMFGTFEQAGVNTQTMVPGLKMALANLNRPTKNLAAEMKGLGISAKDPAEGLKQVFAVMSDKGIPAAKKTGLAMDVFGKRAGPDMAEAVRQGRFHFQKLIDTFEKGKGTILGTAKDTADFGEKWQIVKNRALLAVEPIATQVFNVVGDLADVLIKASDVMGKMPQPVRQIITVAIPLAAAITAAVFAFVKLKEAFIAINLVMRENPYVAIAAATIAVAVLIVTHWDQIKGYLSDAWNAIKSAANAVWGAIKTALAAYWDAIKTIFRDATIVGLIAGHWDAIKKAAANVWNAIKSFLGKVWDAIKTVFRDATIVGLVTSHFTAIKKFVTDAAGDVVSAVRNGWNKAKDVTENVVGDIVSFVKGVPGRVISALGGIVGDLGGKARDAFGAFKDAAADKVGDLISFVKGIPGRIVSGLGNVGNLLYGAGVAIIGGLLRGIEDKVKDVLSFVSGIAGKIKKLKGPLPKDRVLLVQEGQAIIDGLEHGMTDRLDGFFSKVSDIAPRIQKTVADSTHPAPQPTRTGPLVQIDHLEVTDRFDELRLAGDIAWRVKTA